MEDEEITRQIIERVKPNKFNFRWGKTGTDILICFDDSADLSKQIDDLDALGDEMYLKLQAFKFKMNGGNHTGDAKSE